jgi:hypothetical protein
MNVTSWPGTNAVGAGFRGGVWQDAVHHARLSGRAYAAMPLQFGQFTYFITGGRGVRSAP